MQNPAWAQQHFVLLGTLNGNAVMYSGSLIWRISLTDADLMPKYSELNIIVQVDPVP